MIVFAIYVFQEPLLGGKMKTCSLSEERGCRTVQMEIQARLFFGNLLSLGKSTEASEQCMCINTKYRFPLHSWINLLIPFEKDIVSIPCEVCCFSVIDSLHDIMSLQIPNPPEEYLELVNNC